MSTYAQEYLEEARALLEEAKALMGLEETSRVTGSKFFVFTNMDEFASTKISTLPEKRRGRFINLERNLKWTILKVSEVSEMYDNALFISTFGAKTPTDLDIVRRPYSIQFSMGQESYRELCGFLGLKKGYADSSGVCLASERLTPAARQMIDGSVTLVKKKIFPTLNKPEQYASQTDLIPIIDTTGNFYTKQGDMLERLPANYVNSVNSVTERHEEVHAYQNCMFRARYLRHNFNIEQSLLDEEAAECIAKAEHKTRPKKPALMHTSYYDDMGVPYGNFTELAIQMRNVHEAEKLMDQRKRNAEALERAYEIPDNSFRKAIGWTLHLLNFYRVDKMLPVISQLYQTA